MCVTTARACPLRRHAPASEWPCPAHPGAHLRVLGHAQQRHPPVEQQPRQVIAILRAAATKVVGGRAGRQQLNSAWLLPHTGCPSGLSLPGLACPLAARKATTPAAGAPMLYQGPPLSLSPPSCASAHTHTLSEAHGPGELAGVVVRLPRLGIERLRRRPAARHARLAAQLRVLHQHVCQV